MLNQVAGIKDEFARADRTSTIVEFFADGKHFAAENEKPTRYSLTVSFRVACIT